MQKIYIKLSFSYVSTSGVLKACSSSDKYGLPGEPYNVHSDFSGFMLNSKTVSE